MKQENLKEQQLVLEKMRRDFVANVSHELRTPLTVVHGYLETLLDQDHDTTKPWKNIFTQMLQQTTRMENIIEDLLLLSNLESNAAKEIPHIKVDIPALLEDICKEAKTLSGDAQHKIDLHTQDDLQLLGNKDELRSMMSNLIFNAIKYTPAKGNIDIKWYSDTKNTILEVHDTGIGIAKKHIPRLTERFYRVDKARSRDSGGTGLGLAIVKHVLLRHKAKLIITSELGKGSVFTCLFSCL